MTVVVGTRPEAIKLAPVVLGLQAEARTEVELCVTGQHRELLDQVFDLFGLQADVDLGLMKPRQTLNGLASRAVDALDVALRRSDPDWVLVQGDTTSAFAGALAAFHLGAPVAHLEAGLRTGDIDNPFPEEANRRMISCVASLHLAPTKQARDNLLSEGIDQRRICLSGNTVVDAVQHVASAFDGQQSPIPDIPEGVRRILLTVHRRENHGRPLDRILMAIQRILAAYEGKIQVVVPVHPNPEVRASVHQALQQIEGALVVDPLPYDQLIAVMASSHLILTDSGGIQEEAPGLAKPVLVLRETTERPEGIEAGVARLVGTEADSITEAVAELLDDDGAYRRMAQAVSPYGDGQATRRVVDALVIGDER